MTRRFVVPVGGQLRCRWEGDHEHRGARLSRHALCYSHVRMEAKRRALDGIAARQRGRGREAQGWMLSGGQTPERGAK
jgi:hypothetical protein